MEVRATTATVARFEDLSAFMPSCLLPLMAAEIARLSVRTEASLALQNPSPSLAVHALLVI